MTDKLILNELGARGIHAYGSDALQRFEQQLSIYFKREYKRWSGNTSRPEDHGKSSFDGEIASHTEGHESVEHYNRELALYQAFLDQRYMAYTMAYYGATDDDPSIDHSIELEQAQTNKYALMVDRLQIEDGHTVLDLGCGFGGFIRYLLDRFPGIRVIGINPSEVQSDYITQNIDHGGRLKLITRYIDQLDADTIKPESVDRVVSIGVLEHITNIQALSAIIATLLKPGGLCLHHIIVSRDTIPQFLNAEDTMMSDYFPGGHIWPYSELMRHDRHLQPLQSWFINGMNYWKTLDEWHRRFWQSIDRLYPAVLSIEQVDYWNRYFSLCKAMFIPDEGRAYGNAHYLFGKG